MHECVHAPQCTHRFSDAERVLDAEGSGASQSGGFLQKTSSVNVLNSKPFAVDLYTKFVALCWLWLWTMRGSMVPACTC